MRSRASVAIILGSLLIFGGEVRAADLLRPPQPVEPTYYAQSSGYNWTGLYGGAFVGAAHGIWTVDFYRNNNHGHSEEGADGFSVGGWVGYNYQLPNNFVVGVEGDIGFANAEQRNNIFDNDTSLASYGLFGSVRGRLGYAFNRLLIFGTAGIAFAEITNNIQKGRNAGEQVVWEDQTATGYTLGGGAEYAFSDRWIGRVEYQYANFGTVTLYNRDGNRADFENELHLVRAGVSYRF